MVLLVIDTQQLLMNDSLHNFIQFESNISKLINSANANNVEVIYIQHDDGLDTNLTVGKSGFEVYKKFSPRTNQKCFIKQFNSSFHKTGLNDYLQSIDARQLIVCGLQTDLCIDATIKSGFDLGYDMLVAGDANSTVDNQFMLGADSVNYYNKLIWPDRYAKVHSTEELVNLMEANSNTL